MKKLLAYLLTAVMIFSMGLSTAVAADSTSGAGDFTPASLGLTEQTNAASMGNGGHGGHQTRIVHTSKGDYIAYLSAEIKEDPDSSSVYYNEFSIIKVKDGRATLLYQDYISYDSSSISIFADENEEVYAATLVSNKFLSVSGVNSGTNLAVWHVDSATDEVTGYTANIPFVENASYGYAQPVIDTDAHKIYALFSGKDEPGVIGWFIFDLETMKWDPTPRMIEIPERHCYHYAYAQNGGLILVTQRDKLAVTAGHPEIPTAPLWSADYVWDQLDMYCVPNMEDDSVWYSYSVEAADYSRVKDLNGDGKYDSDEERQTNEYPGVGCGDTYLDEDGYLHVLVGISYLRAAYDRKTMSDTQYHKVFDVSDPANVKEIYREQIRYAGYRDGGGTNSYTARLIGGADGSLYIASMRTGDDSEYCGRLQLWKIVKTDDGYDYVNTYLSPEALNTSKINSGMSVATARGNSIEDDTLSLIYAIDTNYKRSDLELFQEKNWYYVTMPLTTTNVTPPEPDDTDGNVVVTPGVPEENITDEMKEAGVATVEAIENKMVLALQAGNPGADTTKTALFEATFMVEDENGKMVPATKEQILQEIQEKGYFTVNIPYSEIGKLLKTDVDSSFSFNVVHMFSVNANGHEAGDVEFIRPSKILRTETGISFRVTGLSPMLVYAEQRSAEPALPTDENTNIGIVEGIDDSVINDEMKANGVEDAAAAENKLFTEIKSAAPSADRTETAPFVPTLTVKDENGKLVAATPEQIQAVIEEKGSYEVTVSYEELSKMLGTTVDANYNFVIASIAAATQGEFKAGSVEAVKAVAGPNGITFEITAVPASMMVYAEKKGETPVDPNPPVDPRPTNPGSSSSDDSSSAASGIGSGVVIRVVNGKKTEVSGPVVDIAEEAVPLTPNPNTGAL